MGAKKPTYDFVKESFESEGYILISSTYIDSKTKLSYECPKGHQHSITWSDWRTGCRCPYCAGKAKPTMEQVRVSFEQEGYILLSTNYVNSSTKLDYICPDGHRHSITWSDWNNSGCRCPYCAHNIKMTIDNIRDSFIIEGYKLVSTEYINSQIKLDYICSFGHVHSISWNNWTQGYRCPTCKAINMSGPGNPNWHLGASLEKYCEAWKDKEYKHDIRDRDQNKCLNPYCNSVNPDDLVIHHINYDKKDCHFKNLITVCRSCNIKANKNRDWHQSWYQAILRSRYGYSY